MKLLKPEFIRKESRGELVQVITGDFKQLNVLKIKKGKAFGGHYHKKKHEVFYIIKGKILLQILRGKKGKVEKLSEGDCFLVEPYDLHYLTAREDSILVEVLSQPFSEEDSYE